MKILFIILLFLISGCATVKPSVAEYKIVTKSLDSLKSSICKDRSLKIAQAFSPSSLNSLNMDYMDPSGKIFSYTQSQWQESPTDAITLELLKSIRSAEIFSSVETSRSRSKSSWILETNIEEFLQFYKEDFKSSYVNIVITISIVDSKTNGVVASKTFNSTVDTKTLDAQGGVEAFDEALSQILSQNIEWLGGICR